MGPVAVENNGKAFGRVEADPSGSNIVPGGAGVSEGGMKMYPVALSMARVRWSIDSLSSTARVSNPTRPKSSTSEHMAIFRAVYRGELWERAFSRKERS